LDEFRAEHRFLLCSPIASVGAHPVVADGVAPGVSRISLGRHSIMVGLRRNESGVLLDDDFLHLPQMTQRPVGISQLVT
jgi:hypothetical protein